MTKQTHTIPIPEGHFIDTVDKQTGEVTYKEKSKHECIRTVADVLADNGLTQEQFDEQCKGLEADEVAYRIIKLLAKSLNQGWTPDWNDEDQWKYYTWFYMGGSSGFRYDDYGLQHSNSNVGSRLCFKSAELAKYAGETFTEVYKQFMLI